MRVRKVKLSRELEPVRITVEMSVEEAALLVRLTGGISPKSVEDALQSKHDPARWFNASAEVFNSLSDVFNRFFEDGVNGVAPRFRGRIEAP